MKQISPSPFKFFMLFQTNSDVNITSHNTRELITLSIKNIIVILRNTRFYSYLQFFLLLFNSFAVTSFAFGLLAKHLASCVTFLATGLSLSIHSRPKLNHSHSYTISFTSIALLNTTSSLTVTISTYSVSCDGHLLHASGINLLKCNLQINQFWLHFFWSIVRLFSIKKIKKTPTTCSRRSTILNTLLTILIIKLSLFRITQSITSLFESFKFLRTSSLVRMLFKCFLSKSLFDLLCCCIFCNFKQLIKLGCIYLLFSSGTCLPCPLISLILPITLIIVWMPTEKHVQLQFIYLLFSSITVIHYFTMRYKKTLHQRTTLIDECKSLPSRTLRSTAKKILLDPKPLKPEWNINRLTTNYIPDEIVGRDQQKLVISTFIQNCVLNRVGSKVLYISGVPGVGKTASTLQILRKLEAQFSNKVQFGFINALTLKQPKHIYKNILAILSKQSENSSNKPLKQTYVASVQKVLPTLKKSHLIVIDEVDYLLTNDQKIFYNLFQWSSHTTSKLGYIIIANTMDFPQKLAGKVNSRMGNNRLVFHPYTYDQIRLIISQRLQGCKLFASNALMFASKKLSTYSSDIRTILEILYKAAKKHEQNEDTKPITIQQILQLWHQKTEIVTKSKQQDLPNLHLQMLDYLKKFNGQCNSTDMFQVMRQKGVSQNSFSTLLKQLQEMGYVTVRQHQKGMFPNYLIKIVYRH